MAISTKKFTLNSALYQDLSEGAANCSFRVLYVSQQNNAIRVVGGTSLPSVETVDYDSWRAPADSKDQVQAHFSELASTDRIYARAESGTATLVAWRK